MSDFPEQELVHHLERLGALEPPPDATRQALERVRHALGENPVIPSPSRRMLMLRRFIGAAAMLVIAAGLLTWWLSAPSVAPLLFADVQTAVKAKGAVACRQTIRVNGRVDNKKSYTILIAGNGLWRTNDADGTYSVIDTNKHIHLLVEPRTREATLMQGVNTPAVNFYEVLKKLPANASARVLPGKSLDGKRVIGFVVPAPWEDSGLKRLELTVWADPRTRLPVRIEAQGKDEKDNVAEFVLDQLVFDKALDERLFDLEAPPGYTLKIVGSAAPPAAANPLARDLIVTPLQGIGPVRFGMSRADVEKALGKAQSIAPIGKNGYLNLSYGSRGFFIGVSKTLGVVTISCSSQKATVMKIGDFTGKTDKGIALGAHAAHVIQAYGAPHTNETKEGSTYLTYDQLQMGFTFFGDRLVTMYFNRPRPR